MVATEYGLIDSNSIQLLYIGPATLTRTATTAPSRGTLAASLRKIYQRRSLVAKSFMYSPDLIQRIFFEKEKGNDSNFKRVFNDFNLKRFDFMFDFVFEDRRIYWTCFESKKYFDIIKEEVEKIYFYLWDNTGEFEIVIPAHSELKDLSKSILERTPSFRSTIWIIGEYFPGLEEFSVRPVKIIMQHIGIGDYREIQTLSYAFRKMLTQFKKKKKPIFEWIDYPNSAKGERNWKKIADKKK